MPDQKVSELPLLTGGVSGVDLIPIVDDPGGSPVLKRVTVSSLLDSGLMGNTPAGNIIATNVQAAINELDTEKAAKIAPSAAGNLAALTAGGDLLDSGLTAANFLQMASFLYDYSTMGGLVGDVTLQAEKGSIPNNAVAWTGFVDDLTPLTSGGAATIALKLQSAADVLTATAYGSIAGIIATIPNGSAANAIKTTASRNVVATIAGAALTAGRFRVVLFYTVSA